MPPVPPTGLQKFAGHLIPIFQSRGLSRTEHTGRSSRDHSGIPRPPGSISERGADARPVPLGSPATTRLTVVGDGTRAGDTPLIHAGPVGARSDGRTRGGFTAIEGLDLDIPDGAFFGLLGPNGAGKTTLIGAVCNLLRPMPARSRCSAIITNPVRHADSSAWRNRRSTSTGFSTSPRSSSSTPATTGSGAGETRRRARELLDLFRLGDKAKSRHTELSGGVQRRLLLARALMHRPRLIILDEPTAGVDVELRAEIWRYTRRLRPRRDHPADHPLPGGRRGALPGDRAAARRADHRSRQPGGSPPPVRRRRSGWGLLTGDGGRGGPVAGGATVSGGRGFPAHGTAQVLAPLSSTRSIRRTAGFRLAGSTGSAALPQDLVFYRRRARHLGPAVRRRFGFALAAGPAACGDSLRSVHLARPGRAGDASTSAISTAPPACSRPAITGM